MLVSLKSEAEQLNVATQGFGNYDDAYTANVVGLGLFAQEQMIPLRYMPLTLELEIVSDYNDAIV
eukprot:13179820-Heterocapsa_arctica.AAC.1